MDPFRKVELAQIESDKDARNQSRYVVTFDCYVGSHRFTIPVAVGDEVEIVRVARARLHQIARALAESSEVWEMPEDQLQDLIRR